MGVVAAAHQVGDAGPERLLAVEAPEPLLQGHHRYQLIGLGPGVSPLRHPLNSVVECTHPCEGNYRLEPSQQEGAADA